MQNIHVRRYNQPAPGGYQGTIEPEDRSWIVFIDGEGHATLWRKAELDLPIGNVPNCGEVISREVWYDVESTMLPSALEEPAAEPPQSASL